VAWPICYADYKIRLREPIQLARSALEASAASNQVLATAAAKGAVVLAAAALERFLADGVEEYVRHNTPSTWGGLAPLQREHLIRNIAYRMGRSSRRIWKTGNTHVPAEMAFRTMLQSCIDALGDPTKWSQKPRFVMLGDKPSLEPARIEEILSKAHIHGVGCSNHIRATGSDPGPLYRSLSSLVESRHTVAHALTGRSHPGPADAATWIRSSFRLARHIAAYLAVS
jgi:hypothetical protein